MTALALFVAILDGASFAPELGQPADEIAINKVIVEMTEEFNQHDAVAATKMYKDDADFVSVRGEVGLGRESAEKGLRRIFETRAKGARLTTEDIKLRFIRPDVALAHVTSELSGLVGPDGQKLAPHKELSLRVFVKDGADWRNTILAPFTGAAVPAKP